MVRSAPASPRLLRSRLGRQGIATATAILAIAGCVTLAGPTWAAPAPAHSVPKRCTFVVDGKRLVDGRCLVFPLGDGGYTLNTWDHGKPRQPHFAQVNAQPGGTGEATWNADPTDDRALDPLGSVRLVNGCWVNARTRICAR